MKLNLITLAMFIVGVVWACLYAPSVEWNAVRIAGAAIAGVSLLLLVVARLQLGAAFSVRAKAKTLVTTGLYSRIRNPIYVFGGIFILGVSMLVERWEILLLIALLVPMQVVRARKEARVLAAAFGEEYARYKARTWF
jgi:protein-S-isoprenylcysteine O-methyltransferase Ste14